MKPLGLYINLPFCIARCAFCAFDVEGFRPRTAKRYLEALRKEIEMVFETSGMQGGEVGTIYFGGGTPSHYSANILVDLLSLCRRLFHVAADAEITVEAHPATVNAAKLSAFREGGINRLSLGMQSFSNQHLRALGRRHTAKQADNAFRAARSAGFTNIGMDLIYALPEQTPKDWENTLQHAVDLSPEHLSIYALSIEERTLFWKKMKEGSLALPSEEETIAFYESAKNCLASVGYAQYEVSNFAKPGYDCRHNLLYWDRGETLAFGASSHAYFNQERRANIDSISAYIETVASGRLPLVQVEKLDAMEAQKDKIIFGLRKREGISIEMMTGNPVFQKITERLDRAGLLTIQKDHVQLTSKGMLLADEVAIAYL